MTDVTNFIFEERSRDPLLLTWYRYIRVLRKTIGVMDEYLTNQGMSRYQFDLLMQIVAEDGVNQQACADRMNVTKGNVAQHVNRLEACGIIYRQKEGRANHLHLTEKGVELIETIMPAHDRRVKEILAVLSEDEIRQFQKILRKIDRNLS